MSGAREDWARIGVAMAQDAGLAGFAAGGAMLAWDAQASRAGYANAAGLALLGRDGLNAVLPAPTRQRLAALAGGLAPREGVRMERLRLTSGFSAAPATCGCRMIAGDDGASVLAIAIPAAELRRLGIAAPAADAGPPAAPTSVAREEPEPAQERAAEAPARPTRALVRFLWQSDKAGEFTSVSADYAELAGSEAAAGLPGRSWRDLLASDVIDRDGGLLERLAGTTTWSGQRVLWRTATGDEGARVELSGVPVLDMARAFAGFRGFGLARLMEREPFPDLAAAPAASMVAPEAERDRDVAKEQAKQDEVEPDDAEPEEAEREDAGRDGAAPDDAVSDRSEPVLISGDASESAADATDSARETAQDTDAPTAEREATDAPESEDVETGEQAAGPVESPVVEPTPAEAAGAVPPAGEQPHALADTADAAMAIGATQSPAVTAGEMHETAPTGLAGQNIAAQGAAGEDMTDEDIAVDDAAGEDPAEEDVPGEHLAGEHLAGEHLAGETPTPDDAFAQAAMDQADDAAATVGVAASDGPVAAAAREPHPAAPAQVEPEVQPRPSTNIVPLRNGHLTAVRPVLEPSKPNLSSAERNAFREIAKALGARIAGEDESAPRLPPAAPLRLKDVAPPSAPEPAQAPAATGPVGDAREPAEPAAAIAAAEPHRLGDNAISLDGASASSEEQRQRLPNSHADVLDRLPVAVLVNRGDVALYANRTLLDLLDYADLADLSAGGGVSRLIKGANRTDGGAMILIDRLGHLVSVDAVLSSVSWLGEPATLMAFRHPDGGGEVKVQTPEEAEDAELAAEFAAEEAESAACVQALRLDVDARESRISELVAMLDTATDGVVTVDERGRMLSLNRTAEALFGYDQREVTGELFTLLFAAESHAPALDYLEGLKGGGVASVMNDGREIVGRVRQGGRIPLFMTMGRIAEGPERRFCAVLRDITAWKKTEGELVEARRAAEKASAQKSDVLAKISHEIRTPLNAIIGFAEVMAEERFGPIANERYKEYLRDIHQSGGYVISLVNDLLDLAKIEAGKLDLDFVSVNLNEIALSTVSLLQTEANRGRVVLRSGLSPKLPPVVADQRSIRQIVINLLSNAVKFTDAGGQVIVSTALGDQGEAILRVRDTGIGMDDHEIELALEPFRQVPTTRRKGGTGLGLPLTKALVEANRAAMTITSVKKEGTLVEITFPPQRVLAG